ncbi:alpha/beta hydrolase [Lysobacter capsici]|uniref:alpha/beta hydrolase n=1 Tax=Lysobacter capsici TaxID=435897 RepID=UPI001C006648|nr:alpha/beta hydrolase [Lysobacter capsici]QWF15864.1 alpha/beta hydrolase [Lysobacter capsici]
MPSLFRSFSTLMIALAALLSSGCERALFGYINRGLPPAEASAVYAPELGLSLDIYRPQPASARAAPVVVFFYGGGWQRGTRAQYRFVGRRLARQGVLTIVADYRTWPRAGFPEFVDDGARAVAWAKANAGAYGGDTQRLFIAGHSAGAQIAALLGTDARYLRRRGVGIDEVAGVIGLSGPYDFEITGQYRKVFGSPAQWPRAQAVNFVDGDEPAFLLIHGDADRVVESRDSVELADKLHAHGRSARLILLPGAGHMAPLGGLYRDERSPRVVPAIVDFVNGDTP